MSKQVLSHILASSIVSVQWEWDSSRTQLEGYQREHLCKIKYQLEIKNYIAFLLLME